jgi:hypothetical protein
MTHDELLAKIENKLSGCNKLDCQCFEDDKPWSVICAVVELHKPMPIATGGTWSQNNFSHTFELRCSQCSKWYAQIYPCPTIQAIEKELV